MGELKWIARNKFEMYLRVNEFMEKMAMTSLI